VSPETDPPDSPEVLREVELGDDTPPRGWTITRWLKATWEQAHHAAKLAEQASSHASVAAKGVITLRADMNEAFKRLGIRMHGVERRVADSQVDAAEAKRKADEVESTAIRNFIEDAKPFARWRRDLVVFALTVLGTVAAAAICDHCGIHPIG
jgi:hypothetical protein